MFLIPTREDVYSYAGANGLNNADLDAFFDYYTRNAWRTGNGEPVKDWKTLLESWDRTAARATEAAPQKPRRSIETTSREDFLTGELNAEVIKRQRERQRLFRERYNDPENHEPSIEYVRQKDREAAEADERKARKN